ncbi:MAG: glucose-6-phosphate isomerase [Pseudomonadota bacterium]
MTPDLNQHAQRLSGIPLKTLAEKAARSGDMALSAAGWNLDMGRQRLDPGALTALLTHGEETELKTAIDALFSGREVNPSEGRAALHWALRAPPESLSGEGKAAQATLAEADRFASAVHSGGVTTTAGAPFKAIVHIGIGGSDFGPRLLADAFGLGQLDGPALRFCANLDPYDLDAALSGLDPTQTLVVGVSKSFGTEETLYNLGRARGWLSGRLGAAWPAHMAIVTANRARAADWVGADGAHVFDMPLTVGGRYSLWSAASVSVGCAGGMAPLEALRSGANAMDRHVREAEARHNLAVRLALLDYWNACVLSHTQRVALAYARRLRLLPTYLQQLEMESNGKSVTPQGAPIAGPTAPALWGGEGSIGQHSYHQWLHQGTQAVATEFILALTPGAEPEGNRALSAHALAQVEVLANGRSLAEVRAEEPDLAPHIAAQKVHAGGRPSTVLFCGDLGPTALGALIALYEHRTYLAGRLWGVNPFDQWGVERGKTMAAALGPVLTGDATANDPATERLASLVRPAL